MASLIKAVTAQVTGIDRPITNNKDGTESTPMIALGRAEAARSTFLSVLSYALVTRTVTSSLHMQWQATYR